MVTMGAPPRHVRRTVPSECADAHDVAAPAIGAAFSGLPIGVVVRDLLVSQLRAEYIQQKMTAR
jgi:hypothetical protein